MMYDHIRYLDDMGPLRKQTFQNKAFRDEPDLASRRVPRPSTQRRVIIQGENVVVGVRGGGLALVTVLPEVIERGCQRNGEKFKRRCDCGSRCTVRGSGGLNKR